MEILKGIGVGDGIAVGRLLILDSDRQGTETAALSPEEEWSRYCAAKEQTARELRCLYDKALSEAGEDAAEIFSMHEMLLDDDDFTDLVRTCIQNGKMGAERAVQEAGEQLSKEFEALEDEYMRARAADFRDIARQVAAVLRGETEQTPELSRPAIVAAEDLTPSQTIRLDKSKILALVTHRGTANSHTAILARSLQIPALIGVELRPDWNGALAVLDGGAQTLVLAPEPGLLREYEGKLEAQTARREEWRALIGQPNITRGGRSIQVFANAGGLEDLDAVCANDAGGIGLFRTEFVFLGSDHWPDEEEQFALYSGILGRMQGKRVIFRTIDLGADKQAGYCDWPNEENPALGIRGIRLCLRSPEIFRTQLRALFRASAFGPMGIMYPMIISEEGVDRVRVLSAGVRQELLEEGVPVGEPEEGIMIETPAAALLTDRLAPRVDFFSIGSNDLTQYTLALDRQNPNLAEFFQPHHEAVLRLIQMTVENAHAAGIWCGICGELGADLALTERFLRLGIDELSVSPGAILPLRSRIRALDTP